MKPILLLLSAFLVACASDARFDRPPQPDIRDIARAIGCTDDQVAVCVSTHCQLEDYQCVERERALDAIWPR